MKVASKTIEEYKDRGWYVVKRVPLNSLVESVHFAKKFNSTVYCRELCLRN